MEDTLRESAKDILANLQKEVLILVLMEDTLRVWSTRSKYLRLQVLILVLMEDTLRVQR